MVQTNLIYNGFVHFLSAARLTSLSFLAKPHSDLRLKPTDLRFKVSFDPAPLTSFYSARPHPLVVLASHLPR